MGDFFTALLAKITGLLTWFGKLWVASFVAVWDVVRDAACWPFEQALSIAQSAVSSVDVSALGGAAAAWGSVPAEVMNILGLLGVGTALSVISAAIVIRLGLQLIPFVRLGS